MPLLIPAATLAIALSTAEPLSINRITINGMPGDQTDPHVSGDLVSYSNFAGTEEIRYYRFSTGEDTAIAHVDEFGARPIDQLSDVSGRYIAFTSTNSRGTEARVMLFDVELGSPEPIEINARSDTHRGDSAIGGNSVAYVDRYSLFTPKPGVIVHFDLITGVETQLSNNGLENFDPAVSPDGNVVTWQRCETVIGCDVVQAVKQPDATFLETDVSNTADEENQADTNGEYVVFVRNSHANGPDIRYRPVLGGDDVRLDLDGTQSNPTISGSLISFEHRESPTSPADIYLYDMLSQRLFSVTNTVFNNETLNDVFVDADGRVRMVWQSDDDADGFSTNIYGAVFTLPPPTPIPLPASAWLLAPALALLAGRRRAAGSGAFERV